MICFFHLFIFPQYVFIDLTKPKHLLIFACRVQFPLKTPSKRHIFLWFLVKTTTIHCIIRMERAWEETLMFAVCEINADHLWFWTTQISVYYKTAEAVFAFFHKLLSCYGIMPQCDGKCLQLSVNRKDVWHTCTETWVFLIYLLARGPLPAALHSHTQQLPTYSGEW